MRANLKELLNGTIYQVDRIQKSFRRLRVLCMEPHFYELVYFHTYVQKKPYLYFFNKSKKVRGFRGVKEVADLFPFICGDFDAFLEVLRRPWNQELEYNYDSCHYLRVENWALETLPIDDLAVYLFRKMLAKKLYNTQFKEEREEISKEIGNILYKVIAREEYNAVQVRSSKKKICSNG